jgi:steroid 5-alpha reductase family enzyme
MSLILFFTTSFFTCLFLLLGLVPVIVWTKKSNIIDAFWGICILLGSISALKNGGIITPFNQIIVIYVLIWALRLSGYILYGKVLSRHHDRRYDTLIKSSLLIATLKQCFFQAFFQALIILTLYPLLSVQLDVTNWAFILGSTVFVIGFLMESLADYQLHQFKQTNKGICNVGLWRFSRHPNYFFDFITWIGISIIFCTSSLFFISIIGPVTLFIIFNYITGPITERVSIENHGENYLSYQQKTSFFIPRRPSL